MLLCQDPGEKSLLAERALPRLDVVMSVHVFGQVVLPCKRFVAYSARQMFNARVTFHVSKHVGFVVKLVVAIVTVEVSLAVMS